MQNKITIKDIFSYIQGNIRYKLYYSKFKWLIREHIREQIEFRINIMEKKCYDQGSCVMCGCTTTALQMANKPCDKPCYPPILSRIDWGTFQKGKLVFINGDFWKGISGRKKSNNKLVDFFKVYKNANIVNIKYYE